MVLFRDGVDQTAVKNDIIAMQTDVTSIQVDTTTLITDVASVQTDTTAIMSDVATLQADATSLTADVALVQTDATSLIAGVAAVQADVETVESHHHNQTHWFGISGDQSGNNWALENGLAPFSANSGNDDFGTEIKVFGPDDTPVLAGMTQFDPRRIMFNTLQATTAYVVQFVWGSGTFAASLDLGNQMTATMVLKSTATGAGRGGSEEMESLRVPAGNKVWARVKNVTNGSTVTFFVGMHEYVE